MTLPVSRGIFSVSLEEVTPFAHSGQTERAALARNSCCLVVSTHFGVTEQFRVASELRVEPLW